MKIGVHLFLTDRMGDIGALAQKAEALGFESIWVVDYPVIPVESSYGEVVPEYRAHGVSPLIALARASASTSIIKLGTGVFLPLTHHPLRLAKEIATLDLYSGGRVIFGVGAGYMKEQIEMLGGDFQHRWSHTREVVLAMKALWTQDSAEYHGKYIDFPPVHCFPRPAQSPHPPILLGSNDRNVFNRVVAWGDGWYPPKATLEEIKRGRATLDEMAAAAGRDPKSIEICVGWVSVEPYLDNKLLHRGIIDRFEQAGTDTLLVGISDTDNRGTVAAMEDAAERVLR